MSNLWDKGIVGVGVCKHGADGQKNCLERLTLGFARQAQTVHTFGYCQSRAPLVSKNVQTNTAVRVDVGMVDSSCEVDLWWLERVVCGEMDG